MSEEFGQVWVVRTTHKGTGRPVEGVFDELCRGCARIGWSSEDDEDLRIIHKIKGEDLNERQEEAKRCLRFLNEMEEGDVILYPHQPERYKLSVVRVIGEYGYDHGLGNGDFRSVRPCELISKKPVDMYDEIVPASLHHKLVYVQPRIWRFKVDDMVMLKDFLNDLTGEKREQGGAEPASIRRIHAKLRKALPDEIRREFSRVDLTRKFCRDLFSRMDYDPEIREGPAEAGSDIIVTVGDPLLPDEGLRVGVQAFAFEGNVHEDSLERKLNQLLKGWKTNNLDYGVLLTTGIPTGKALEVLVSHNEENPTRHVKLIDGDALADLFLQHFPPAEGGADSGR